MDDVIHMFVCLCACASVCVCVSEREKEQAQTCRAVSNPTANLAHAVKVAMVTGQGPRRSNNGRTTPVCSQVTNGGRKRGRRGGESSGEGRGTRRERERTNGKER